MRTLSTRSRFAILAVLILVSVSVIARQGGGYQGDRSGHRGPPDAESKVARMTQMLDLSDEQSADLLIVLQESDREKEALRQEFMEQMKPELCELEINTMTEFARILTEEQMALLEEKKENRGNRGRRGMAQLDCSEFE